MRSGFEHMIDADLQARGVKYGYETEVLKYKSRVKSGECSECGCTTVHQHRSYTPDFVVPKDGKPTLYIEAKGILDSPTRSKMRDVKKAFPDHDIRFMFQGKATWARSKSVIRWCEKFKFPYHFGHEVPEEWLS